MARSGWPGSPSPACSRSRCRCTTEVASRRCSRPHSCGGRWPCSGSPSSCRLCSRSRDRCSRARVRARPDMAQNETTRLLEALLEDPAFRSAFRADPPAALRGAGLGDLADRAASAPARKAFQTLEIRESRSSLAGAMMAVVAEGLAITGPASASAASPPVAPAPAVEAHAAASPAGSRDPDDVVEIVERRNVAAQQNLETHGADGVDADRGDSGAEESSGDQNEADENEHDDNESDENESDSGGDE